MTYTKEFEQFWALYPKGYRCDGKGSVQGSKEAAARAWKKRSVTNRAGVMKAVIYLKKHQYLPQASRWINEGLFDTVLENESVITVAKVNVDVQSRQKYRDQYTSWISEQDDETLRDFVARWPNLNWLVEELRPEIGKD